MIPTPSSICVFLPHWLTVPLKQTPRIWIAGQKERNVIYYSTRSSDQERRSKQQSTNLFNLPDQSYSDCFWFGFLQTTFLSETYGESYKCPNCHNFGTSLSLSMWEDMASCVASSDYARASAVPTLKSLFGRELFICC